MALLVPEFLQTQSYTGRRMRLVYAHSGYLQPGVFGANDLKVSVNANMVLNVAAGHAIVAANHPGNAGLYRVENDATLTSTISTAHATLPRIDQLAVRVNDVGDGASANDTPAIVVLAGTATAGATLNNRTGAATLPAGHLRIADVLVGAGVTSISAASIRDRRPWARGAFWTANKTSAAITVATAPAGTYVPYETATFQQRLELTGNIVEVSFGAQMIHSVSGNVLYLTITYSLDGTTWTSLDGLSYGVFIAPNTSAWEHEFSYSWDPPFTAPTSVLMRLEAGSNPGTVQINGAPSPPITMRIEELMQPSVDQT